MKYIKGKENQIQRGNQFVIRMTGTPKTIRQACHALVVIEYTNKKTFAPRWERICSKCRIVGNFSVVCRSVREGEVNSEGRANNFSWELLIHAICQKSRGALRYKPVQFKIDTGADISILSTSTYHALPQHLKLKQ